MILRTSAGKTKNGMTASQLRRQLCAIAGYLRPHGPWSNVSSSLAAAAALSARYTGLRAAAIGLRSFQEANCIE
jgi:hypothetical protein